MTVVAIHLGAPQNPRLWTVESVTAVAGKGLDRPDVDRSVWRAEVRPAAAPDPSPHLPILRPLPEQGDGAREVLRVGEQREGRNLDPPVHPVGPQDREDPVGRLALQHRDTQR